MRGVKIVLLSLAVMGFTAQSALAANVHFKHGSPVFTDAGLYLNSTGKLAGLGNGDLVIQLTAQGQPVASCTNPAGETKPPGRNPAVVTLGGLQAIPGAAVKNGNASFDVNTGTPETPVQGAPECPNTSWTEDISDVIFAGFPATITVFQGVGCAIDPGPPPAPNSSCVQVFQQTFTV